MQNQNAQAWTLPPAGERPEFGATVIPDHPGYLMPSPVALHQAFHGALAELEAKVLIEAHKPNLVSFCSVSR